MLALTHTVTSAVIGTKIGNPVLCFVLGLALHYLEDSFLHWNFFPHKHKYIKLWAFLDVLSGLVLSWLIFREIFFTIPVLAAVFGGLLPDVISFGAPTFGWNWLNPNWHKNFHDTIQKETEIPWKGLISQALFLVIFVFLFYFI